MTLGFLILSIIIFLLTIIFAFSKKDDITKVFRIFASGILLISVIILIPLISLYNENAEINDKIPFVTILFSVLQLSTLDADYNLWARESAKISLAYHIFCMMICYSMPLIVGGLILSFFESFIKKIKYKILRGRRSVFYFSCLNEKNLYLAKTINVDKKNALIVFCNSCNEDPTLLEEAKNYGFLSLSLSETELLHASKFGSNYFEFYTDEDKNLSVSIEIIKCALKLNEKKQHLINIFTLSSQSETTDILTETNTGMINVVLVNPTMKVAYDLLYSNPLTTVLKDTRKIKCLILGSNKITEEIVKAIIWCGQLGKDYSLSLLIVDKNATFFEACLQRNYPEMINGIYDIKFIDCDIRTNQISSLLEKNAFESNYIVISSDNDEENFRTATYLRTFFLRHNIKLQNKPNISVLISNTNKEKNLKLINNSAGYDFFYFGETHSVFDYKSLVDSELEKIAINVSNSYQTKYNKDFHPSKEELERLYYSNEKDRRSNRANALHYIYRLFLLGYSFKQKNNASSEELHNSEKIVEQLKSKINEPGIAEKFAIIEHDRWTAFNRTEGYTGATFEIIKKYMPITNSHKYPLAKYHACICSWEKLGKLDETLGTNFRSYDSFFINDMFEILGITQNSSINISGIQNILIDIKENS